MDSIGKAKDMYISDSVKHFKNVYEKLYGVKSTNDINPCVPTLFVGCYTQKDIDKVLNHDSLAILVWMGIDASREKNVSQFIGKGNIRHIAISHWIYESLIKNNIVPKYIHLPNTDINYWKPHKLGDKIYSYAPNEVYKQKFVKEIAKEVPFDLILVDSHKKYSRKQLREIYKKCFVGLRLREFDGCPATINEMGLMGRKTISNVGLPSCLPWYDKDEIIENIMLESKKIGKIPGMDEYKFLYNYLNVGDNWLKL